MNKNTTNRVTDNGTRTPRHDGANTNTKEQSFWNWDSDLGVLTFNCILIVVFIVILSFCIRGMSWDLMTTIISIISGCALSSLVSMLSSSKCIWSDKFLALFMIIPYISLPIVFYMCFRHQSPDCTQKDCLNAKILLLSAFFALIESLIVCFVLVPLLQKRQRAR